VTGNLRYLVVSRGRERNLEGVSAFQSFDVQAFLSDHDDMDIRLKINLVDGTYRVTRLEVNSLAGEEVTGDFIRKIPVRSILRSAVGWELKTLNVSSLILSEFTGAVDAEETRLRKVAATYRVARLIGDPPTGAVMEAEEVSRSTATRLVAAARDAGFLGEDEVGHAGGVRSNRISVPRSGRGAARGARGG
jgi:hypothetical protein